MTDARPGSPRWSLIGPGIVVAATGVGAGDLIATLIAGSRFGYALLWAAVVGTVLKIALAEGVGRWSLASGRTMFDGWSSLPGGVGRVNWATAYFGVYVVLWGFVYGGAAMTAAALPLATLMPVLDLKTWGMLSGVLGLILVWFGGYGLFEKIMTALVGVMFVTVVGLAVIVTPDLPSLLRGAWPTFPEGSLFYTLGLIGGVGGTITIAAYGYWLRAKGWGGAEWMGVMRLDNRVAYAVTGVFVVAMPIAVAFLVGFWATSFSSLIGVWQGVSLLFGDFWAHMRGRPEADGVRADGGPAFRAYALWLTFPPMLLLFMDRPFALIIAYGALGALFMPFLAGTLLWLLNSSRTPAEWRSGWLSNTLLTAAALLFAALAARELIGLF